MYTRSSSPENQDTVSTGSNQGSTFINTTQRRVFEELVSNNATQNSAPVICTQERESSDSTQKLTLIDLTESLPSCSEETHLSMNLSPGRVSRSLLPDFFSELPIVTSSTQIPTIQAITEDAFETNLPNQVFNQDYNVSSQPNQNLDEETISLVIADPALSIHSSPSEVAECTFITAADFYQDEKIEAVETTATVKPDAVNEESTPARVLRKGTKRNNPASEVLPQEPRKRRSKGNVNYCEELNESIPANPTKKKAEKAKGKQSASLKEKEGIGGSSTANVEEKKKKRSKEDDEDEAGDMPKRKSLKISKGKEKEDAPVADTEDKEAKVNQFLQNKDSFLTTIDLRELIPQWLAALPEEDRLELAPLLPEPDCEIKEEQLTIGEGFGANSGYLHEAAAQWQAALVLGGFEKDGHEPEVPTDPFKDENFERNWGEKISRYQKAKTKERGRSKKNK